MAITPAIEQWLQEAGYEYHCFVSWAHTKNRDMTECARYVKDAVEEYLALVIPEPKVFLDETGITGGAKWQKTLEQALYRSIAMVAICAPIYYHPSHRWCGLEWAAMDMLSEKRLPSEDFKAIIPIVLRKREPLPEAISRIQYIDFSRVTICGRRFFTTQEFRLKIRKIVEHIEKIAEAIVRNGSRADCNQFQFPTESAFSNYDVRSQSFPFHLGAD